MKDRWKAQIALLSLGHGMTDAYGSAFSPLLPALVQKLSLSKVDVGILVAVLSIGTSLTQVVFGYLADRFGRPFWIVLGPAIGAIFMSHIGVAPSFSILLLFLFLGGCGIASYHPQGAAAAGRVHDQHKGLAMSLFTVGGTAGYASGPLLMGRLGLEHARWAMFPGVVLSLVLYWLLFHRQAIRFPQPMRKRVPLVQNLLPHLGPVTLLFLIVVFRACTSIAYVAFLPLFLDARGMSDLGRDSMVSLFLIASALGSLVGGTLSDFIDRKRLLVWSLIGSVPFLALAPGNEGWTFALFLFLGGFILASSQPINIILGQQILPKNASMASSLMMGLAWGVGGLLNILIGKLAEAMGVRMAVQLLPVIPLLTTPLAMLIPAHRVRKEAAPVAEP